MGLGLGYLALLKAMLGPGGVWVRVRARVGVGVRVRVRA